MHNSSVEVSRLGSVTLTRNSPTPPTRRANSQLRKSISDPTNLHSFSRKESAVETLDRCSSLVSLLGSRVDRCFSLINTMPGICKKCHGQTGSAHVGSRWGFAVCTLPHNEGCMGGVSELPGVRCACPDDFVVKSAESGNETEVSQQRSSDLDDDFSDSDETDNKVDDPDYVPHVSGIPNAGPGLSSCSSAPPLSTTVAGLSSSSFASSIFPTGAGTTTTPSSLFCGPGLLSAPGVSSLFGGLSAPGLSSCSATPKLLPVGINTGAPGSLFGGLGQGSASPATSTTINPGLTQAPEDLSQTWLLQQLLQQQQQAQLQQQQQQQKMMIENQKIVEEMRLEVIEAKKAARSAASVRRKTSSVSFSDTVTGEAEALKAMNARQTAAKMSNLGYNMNDVRKTPNLRDEVEEVMASEVYKHPSLAPAPSAGSGLASSLAGASLDMNTDAAIIIESLKSELSRKQHILDSFQQQHGQQSLSKADRRAARKAVTEQRLAARKEAADKLTAAKADIRRAKKAASAAGVPDVSSTSDSDSDDESDLERTLTKERKKKKKSRATPSRLGDSSSDDNLPASILTDKHGRAFKVVDGKLESLPTYVKDPISGKLIMTTPTPVHENVVSSDSSDSLSVKEKKHKKKEKQKAKKAAGKESASNHLTGITPLSAQSRHLPPVPQSHNSKGKGIDDDSVRTLSVVDWAKMCPIKYAANCNSKNLNLPVFIWAKLAELRALSAGALETKLSPGELDARLRHLQCVMELVGTNSTLTEYASYGWQLARDYDRKVQATMDSGASDWVNFNSMFALGPHPSFVLSAKDEVERFAKKRVDGKGVDIEDTNKVKKKVCGKFNSSKTSKRCEWEVENPHSGRCKRLHQCSFCKVTHNKSVFHQAWDCPAGGKEAVASGTHSL